MSEIPNPDTRSDPPRMGSGVEPRPMTGAVTGARVNGDSGPQHADSRTTNGVGASARPTPPQESRHIPPHEDAHDVPPLGSEEPSLGELVSSLSDDFTTLVRKEFELAVAEMQENVKEAVRAGTMLGVAGFLGYAGLILLLIAASLWLGSVLENLWLGTGIVGLIVVVIAGILYASGKSKLDDVDLTPRKAIKSVERDIDMAKEKLS